MTRRKARRMRVRRNRERRRSPRWVRDAATLVDSWLINANAILGAQLGAAVMTAFRVEERAR